MTSRRILRVALVTILVGPGFARPLWAGESTAEPPKARIVSRWLLVGGGATLAIAGGLQIWNAGRSEPSSGEPDPDAERSRRRVGQLALGTALVGVAALGTGLYLYLSSRPTNASQANARWNVALLPTAEDGGLFSFSSRFH